MNFKLFKRIGSFLILLVGIQFITGEAINYSAQAKSKIVAVDPNQKQTINLGLRGRNQNKLTRFINQTVTPGNYNYRKYLTPQQFGQRYGATDQEIKVVGNYMKRHHLLVYTYPGKLFMNVSGKNKDLEKAFNVKLQSINGKNFTDQQPNHKYRLPSSLTKIVTYEYGLKNTFYASQHHSANADASNNRQQSASVREPNIMDESYQKFNRIAHNGDLYQNGNAGQNQRLGIITSARMRTNDLKYYINKYKIPFNLNQYHVHYGSDHQSIDKYGYETAMDVEQSAALAPKANLNLYLSPNFMENFANAIGRDNVDVITNSYGTPEIYSSKAEANMINQLLRQAAAQGISTFSSSGDTGPYNFYQRGSQTHVRITTQIPASSPYVTAVGGTTLPFQQQLFSRFWPQKPNQDKMGTLDREHAWSSNILNQVYGTDYVNKISDSFYLNIIQEAAQKKGQKLTPTQIKAQLRNIKLSAVLGSGGGFSKYFTIPNYQTSISGAGTYNAKQLLNLKTWDFNNHPQIISGTHSGRNVPDISCNADLYTGYQVRYQGNWRYFQGGTSIVTPQFAAMATLINSLNGQRMGFWNPQIYRFARSEHSPFTPLNSLDDDNLYFTGQPGKLYNQATGLGTVNFNQLNQAFTNAK